ncbi:MAG: hypothetical protein EA412_11075 [Chitinophagaceae bacterium]|nr:MAG: hypothetical protein EA412_11075 [Chitinophagaceae bacterium]
MKLLLFIIAVACILFGFWNLYFLYKNPLPKPDYNAGEFRGYLFSISLILLGIVILLREIFEVVEQGHPVIAPFSP